MVQVDTEYTPLTNIQNSVNTLISTHLWSLIFRINWFILKMRITHGNSFHLLIKEVFDPASIRVQIHR